MDKETRELLDSLLYDIGQMPYKFMSENPAARSAFFSYEALKIHLARVDAIKAPPPMPATD